MERKATSEGVEEDSITKLGKFVGQILSYLTIFIVKKMEVRTFGLISSLDFYDHHFLKMKDKDQYFMEFVNRILELVGL